MPEPQDLRSHALTDLAHFEARMSPAGQLRHYAKGRIRSFGLRQTLTVFGAVTIGLLASAKLGMVLAALALAGEAFDIICLSQVLRWLDRDRAVPWPRRVAMLSGAVQACTIAGCVMLTWRGTQMHEARFFASAFLIAAVINAGLARPHLRVVADLRLSIFAATGFAMMALDLAQAELATSLEYGFFAAAFGLLAYISILFIEVVERNYLHRRRNEYALLKHQHEQVIAQAALARSARDSQRLALVANYARDSIIISGPDGRIEWVNDAFTRITGFGFAEVLGKLPADILNAPETDPATTDRLAEARTKARPVRAEVLNRGKSGRLFWMETSLTPITDATGRLRHWIAVEREITEAKEREAELARARAAADEAGQSKSRFLANMSHEIRTPMNGVIGVAELLAETRLTAAQREYVETILESGRLLLAIINDILDLAKLQSGKSMLESRAFCLSDALEAVMRMLAPVAAKKGLDLRLEMAGHATLRGDEAKLKQILLNLIGNAVKFTLTGAVTVTVRLPGSDGMLEIDVADTGIGISPDRIGRIFDSFSQADNGISRQFGGTGLGLTICSMLAEQMGGGISVRSQIGHGSVFTLRAALPQTERAVEAAPTRSAVSLRPGLRVMLAEDNRTNMMILRKMLKGQIPILIEAENGEEAVRLYAEHPPDLVLMDVSMPLKDGLQATREIRRLEAARNWPRCPIVALTANAFGEDRAACRAAGLDGFLVKPLSRADLLAEIEAHCPALPAPRRQKGL